MSDYLVDKSHWLSKKKKAKHTAGMKVTCLTSTTMMAFFLLLWLLNVTTESNNKVS